MGSVHPSPQFQAFDPESAEVMLLAFHTAYRELLVSGSELVGSFRAEATREALALRIIDLAQAGERDVVRLRDEALAYVLHANQRAPAVEDEAGLKLAECHKPDGAMVHSRKRFL
jgi:hypothetical protein